MVVDITSSPLPQSPAEGQKRVFNRRFLALMNHYLIELTACALWRPAGKRDR